MRPEAHLTHASWPIAKQAQFMARYGRAVLIHWEDVSSRHSFRLLEQLSRTSQPTFNDDIQCTSVITLAALLGSTGSCKRKHLHMIFIWHLP
eukprot:scaffold176566_cov19-Tisochrysis_lutea.AAC.2